MTRMTVALGTVAALLLAAHQAQGMFFGADQSDARLNTVTLNHGDIERLITATGALQPRDFVDVGAQVSGQLQHIHVEVGAEVQAGELLAEIDATVFMARVDERRAQLRFQQGQMKDREAQLELARLQLQRQRNLLEDNATTEQALQEAAARHASARAQMDMIRAQIEQTESSLRADEANLDYARIHAPISGTVVSISARQGQTLNANQQAPVILRIADLSTMVVETEVSEADVGKLAPNMPVYFTTLGGGERRFHGQLSRVEPTPTVSDSVVLYKALFEVDNPRRELLPRMTAQVFFIEEQSRDTWLLPVAAVESSRRPTASPGKERQGMVRILGADGQVEARRVTLGIANRIHVEVLSGIEPDEQVVLPQAGLRTSRRGG